MKRVNEVRRSAAKRASATNNWLVGGVSVQGSSHRCKGIPNQDAIGWRQRKSGGLPIVLALADGHGSPAYPRSDIGSRFAVDAALNSFEQLYADHRKPRSNGDLFAEVGHRFSRSVLEKWRRSVSRHWDHHPKSLCDAYCVPPSNLPNLDARRHIYGSTLLVIAVDSVGILFCQLGDGNILEVASSGVPTPVFAPDPQLVGNETTSLCTANSSDFRVAIRRFDPTTSFPSLLIAATDGYANSFAKDSDFFKVGADYLDALRKDGLAATLSNMESWLGETSAQGSGDDISCGLIWPSWQLTRQLGSDGHVEPTTRISAHNKGVRKQ